jgi:hypothetical protein
MVKTIDIKGVKIDCSSLFIVPATSAAQNRLLFFFFLLRPFTVLMKKTHAVKQSIIFRCLWLKQSTVFIFTLFLWVLKKIVYLFRATLLKACFCITQRRAVPLFISKRIASVVPQARQLKGRTFEYFLSFLFAFKSAVSH